MKTVHRVLVRRIRKELRFEAGHVLRGLPSDHPCSTPHGHSYRFVVELVGTAVDEYGFLLDFNLLKGVRDRLDHTFLNSDFHQEGWKKSPLPPGLNPTAENIAAFIYQAINDIIFKLDAAEDVKVAKVGVWETETSYAEVEAIDLDEEITEQT